VSEVTIRRAIEPGLPRIVELIHLGAWGDSAEQPGPPLPAAYLEAFRAIHANPATALMVAELEGEVVGTFQFAVLRGLSHVGRPVAQVESVHVAKVHRAAASARPR
jgi:hypothetical protein